MSNDLPCVMVFSGYGRVRPATLAETEQYEREQARGYFIVGEQGGRVFHRPSKRWPVQLELDLQPIGPGAVVVHMLAPTRVAAAAAEACNDRR